MKHMSIKIQQGNFFQIFRSIMILYKELLLLLQKVVMNPLKTI